MMFGGLMLTCQNRFDQSDQETEKVYYFDFDEVDHFSIEIDRTGIDSLSYRPDSLSQPKKLMSEMILLNEPYDFDTAFIKDLESVGFVKHDVPKEKNEEVNDLFCEKGPDPNDSWAMCMPEYRDILIFRRGGVISGFAKVCFGCDILLTRGTSAETKYFGSYQGFEKLYAILYPDSAN